MQNFSFSCFQFTIQAETPVRLPRFKGSAFRGGFGMAFKRAVCVQRRTGCTDCLLRRQCVYSLVFETPVPPDAELMRKYPAAPHPFVIEPPETPQLDFQPGEQLAFGIILIGRAVDYLPYFIFAFEQLGKTGFGTRLNGKRGRYQLLKVTQQTPGTGINADEKTIYHGDDKTLTAIDGPISGQDVTDPLPGDTLTLTFHTPIRVKYRGRFTDRLDFHILFRNLLRRVSLLSYFHCGHRLDDSSFPDLIRRAETIRTVRHDLRWQDQRRWSGRQKTTMMMGGLIGTVKYKGDLTPFLPYIELGRCIHCGKGCTFGLGRYTL